MKHDAFWQSARILLRYKRLLAATVAGAAMSAATFGAGLAMIMPTLSLLLDEQRSLPEVVRAELMGAEHAPWKQALGAWLLPWMPEGAFTGLMLIIAVITGLTIVGCIGTYIRELAAITISLRAVMTWRRRLFRRFVHVPLEISFTHSEGDHVSRLLVDTHVMARGYTMLLGRTLGDVLGCAAAVTVAVALNWRLSAIGLVTVPIMLVLLRKFGKVIRRATRRVLHEQGRIISALGESLGALRVIKVHDAEGQERRRFASLIRGMYRQEIRARRVRAATSPMMRALMQIAVAGIALAAGWLVLDRGVPFAELFTVLAALVAAAASVRPLAGIHNQLHESSAAAQRVLAVMDLPVEPSGAEAARAAPALPRHAESIVFEGIAYRYPGAERPAIRDVDLEIRFGQTAAIVGANGSGKSTLTSLLPRLVDPSHGRVLVDGVDIATVRLRSLRRQIGVVTQDTILFHGTIADNIAFGRRFVDRERIVAAARSAYAHDFITALPQGYDTMLGDGGSGLSGGQRQRLCIARALLREPAIMILDEATSQIDADSEAKIGRALADGRRRRTTIVIAHRLSTVVDADVIVVMEDGRIVDRGRHAELLDRCAVYRTLNQTQLQPLAAGTSS